MGHVILGLLLLAPQTSYALNKQFEGGISLFYRASYGSLQSALKSLLARGLISFTEQIEGGRNKKTYAITDDGRVEFFGWLRGPVPPGGNLEVIALSKLFFLGLLSDAAERRTVLAAIVARVDTDTSELEALAEHVDGLEIPPEFARIFHYQRLTLDYGLATTRVGRDWFASLATAEVD